MNRRTFLRWAGAGGIVGGSGCVGGRSDTSTAEPTPTRIPDEQTPTSTPDEHTSTSRATEASTSEADIQVIDQELIHEGEGEDAEASVEMTVENTTNRPVGQVVATATFVEEETLLGSWVATANGMEPGQQWLVSIGSGGTSGEDALAVDDVRVEAEERTLPTELGNHRVEIVENSVAPDGDIVRAEGLAENVTDERLEYAEVVATFVSDGGALVGTALADTVRDVDPGQQFEFGFRHLDGGLRDPPTVTGCQLTGEGRVEE